MLDFFGPGNSTQVALPGFWAPRLALGDRGLRIEMAGVACNTARVLEAWQTPKHPSSQHCKSMSLPILSSCSPSPAVQAALLPAISLQDDVCKCLTTVQETGQPEMH